MHGGGQTVLPMIELFLISFEVFIWTSIDIYEVVQVKAGCGPGWGGGRCPTAHSVCVCKSALGVGADILYVNLFCSFIKARSEGLNDLNSIRPWHSECFVVKLHSFSPFMRGKHYIQTLCNKRFIKISWLSRTVYIFDITWAVTYICINKYTV